MCFFKNNTHKQRRKGNKEEKKKRRQACSFSRLLGDKFELVCCLCGGKFVVSKFACGAVRLHACSVHSNALGKSGQQWSLNQLTGRCALCCYIRNMYTNHYAACPSFLYNFITALVVCLDNAKPFLL